MQRKIVKIDQQKCNGCGLCVPSCHEGAIQIVNGKATLLNDSYCDGLGACLGDCPQGAITLEEREADAFDEAAVAARQQAASPAPAAAVPPRIGGCPGLAMRQFAPKAPVPAVAGENPSFLQQWPVQLHLVPVQAPYWQNAHLLLCADCVAVAYGNFQSDLVRNRALMLACPKLDDSSNYQAKLTAILTQNQVLSLTVAHMEVPCCSGIVRLAQAAVEQSGKSLPLHIVRIGIDGRQQANTQATER